jgi:hypothetical protein
MTHPIEQQSSASLFRYTGARSRRASSWDRTGGIRDFITVGPHETVTLLELQGPGCITHFYCALAFPELTDYRDASTPVGARTRILRRSCCTNSPACIIPSF